MENVKQIINNRKIEGTSKNIFILIIIFGLLLFISGFFLSYVIITDVMYNKLYDLINNNGYLIFDDKYYKFIEVYPNMEYSKF